MMDRKQSRFTAISSIPDGKYLAPFGNGTNERITKENLFKQIKDETQIFIYPTIEQLQAANLIADHDWPIYVRVEETEFHLYKITSLAAGANDIELDNGLTATRQDEYSEIGFVVGPSPSTDGAIALFDGVMGTQLKNGPTPTDTGVAFITVPDSVDVGYPRKNNDNTVSILNENQLKSDLDIDQVNNAAFNNKVTGPDSSGDDQVALFDGATGKLIKAGQTMAQYLSAFLVTLYNIFPRKIDTWSAISSITPVGAGQLFNLAQHTANGVGGGTLMAFAGAVVDDGGTQKNALGGFYLKRIGYDYPHPEFWGATIDSGIDTSTAVQTAANNNPKYLEFTAHDYKVDTALTGSHRFGGSGFSFSGANAPDAWCPVRGMNYNLEMTGDNALIGASLNKRPAATVAFPTGTTGYGRSNNAGNQVFGLFGRADLYNTGVATNEVNCFNFFAPATTSLPPNRGIGTPQTVPVALTVAAGGNFTSAIGIHIAQEGGTPNKFNTGMYLNADSCVTFGVYVAADATNSPAVSARLENSGAGTNLILSTRGAISPSSSVMTVVDSANNTKMAVKQDGHLFFSSGIVQSTHGAAGGAAALPATPTGYLQIEIGGAQKVIPYYEP